MSERMVRVIVRGMVQGVGFRAFVEDEASIFGLEGWVRNRRDGTVEAVLAGDAKAVDEMIAACRRGPETARIDDVAATPATADDLKLRKPGEHFSVLMTV